MTLVIRRARPGDADSIARVHVETWQTTYAGVLPDDYLLRLGRDQRSGHWTKSLAHMHRGSQVLVAEAPRAGVVGYASFGRARAGGIPGAVPWAGEVYTLYVLADYQGLGLGRALLTQCFASLKARGRGNAIVWVLADNPSRFFYERLGGKQVAERTESFAGTEVREFAYGWRELPL